MKEFLIKYGWIHFASGCPCIGLPRYYKHSSYPDYKIILKSGQATIRKNGATKFTTKEIEQLKQKMQEYEIITEDQNMES